MPIVLEKTPQIFMEKEITGDVFMSVISMSVVDMRARESSIRFDFAYIQNIIDGLIALRDEDQE